MCQEQDIIEESDPEFAALILQVVQINSQYSKSSLPIRIENDSVYFKNKKVHIERNELCPCSSGKKYKKCCGH